MDPQVEPAVGLGLFLLTFVSEDAATFSGATLAAVGMMGGRSVFWWCLAGVWLGDLGLFGLARGFGRPLLDRLGLGKGLAGEKVARSEAWFARHGTWALVLCRFVPGTRLPTFLTAGLLRVSAVKFGAVTGAMSLLWVGGIFLLVREFGAAAGMFVHSPGGAHLLTAAGVLALVAGLALRRWRRRRHQAAGEKPRSPALRRWMQWEFWPAWLFYLPVGLNYLRLGVKYRGFNLPTCANPGMYTGGLIGESKHATLAELQAASPAWVAESFLLDAGWRKDNAQALDRLVAAGELGFPLVLKPDVAQRGSGFKVARAPADARAYLAAVDGPIIAQRYVPGPHEIGVFYYRFPHEPAGRIFAITEKIFPHVFGDGHRTLEELIRADARAAILSRVYLARFERERGRVPAFGEAVRLVEAGNHAQGCIFQDGMHLWSEPLQERIDAISRALPGFFIGRYDLRYASPEALQEGRGFTVLELNGAASEATSAYDARKSLADAYRLLFEQWELVFAIGAANRRAGHAADSLGTIWKEMRRYRRRSACYPVAD